MKSGFRVTPEVGMYRACEIKIQIDNCVFEVPLLGPGMRGLCRELRFGGVSPNTAAFAILIARDRFLVFFDVRKLPLNLTLRLESSLPGTDMLEILRHV